MKDGKTHCTCLIHDLGLIEYQKAYEIQKRHVGSVLRGKTQVLLFCEHPPVLTLGRLADEKNILTPQKRINEGSIKVLRIDRGGDVTLHGPGQLVVYPILDLTHWDRDLRSYMHKLEEVAIDLLSGFGIVTNRVAGQMGVWVGDKKLVSIGIGVKKWVSFHGLAINVNTDLKMFSMIRPCGMDVQMTTISMIKGESIDIREVKKKMVDSFGKIFGLTCIEE